MMSKYESVKYNETMIAMLQLLIITKRSLQGLNVNELRKKKKVLSIKL